MIKIKKNKELVIEILNDLGKKDLFSDEEILNEVGFSIFTWGNIKNGKRISVQSLQKIAKVTKRPLRDYLNLLED